MQLLQALERQALAGGRQLGLGAQRRRGGGQLQLEGGAGTGHAAQLQLDVEQLAQPAHDRQPQAQPLAAVALGVADLVELLEDVFMLARVDADSGVDDGQRDAAVAFAAHAQGHRSGGRELDRVADQVVDDAQQLLAVAAHVQRPADGRVDADLQPVALRRRRLRRLHGVEQAAQLDGLDVDVHHARVERGLVHELVQQAAGLFQVALHGPAHAFQQLVARALRELLQRRVVERECKQRLAQVVAGGSEEARLGGAGELRLLALGLGALALEVDAVAFARQHLRQHLFLVRELDQPGDRIALRLHVQRQQHEQQHQQQRDPHADEIQAGQPAERQRTADRHRPGHVGAHVAADDPHAAGGLADQHHRRQVLDLTRRQREGQRHDGGTRQAIGREDEVEPALDGRRVVVAGELQAAGVPRAR